MPDTMKVYVHDACAAEARQVVDSAGTSWVPKGARGVDAQPNPDKEPGNYRFICCCGLVRVDVIRRQHG